MNVKYTALFLCLILSACSSGPSEAEIEQTVNARLTESAPTATAISPTNTPKPTNTPRPTRTPTKRPTATKVPTATATPEPITLTGSGDSVIDVDIPFEFGIVHIVGNAAGRFFAVENYGAGNERIGLLVNTTDPYDGVRPLDFRADEHTTRFQVQAVGNWTIEVLLITSARRLEVPGTIEGVGDDVIILLGGTPDLAKVKGNAGGRFFAVTGWGDRSDLLVNTTDPYDGTVIVSPDTVVLEVEAIGEWSIEITE